MIGQIFTPDIQKIVLIFYFWLISSDNDKKILQEVFPDTPHQWCQYHYLEKLDDPLEDDLKKLSEAVGKTVKDVKDPAEEIGGKCC